MGAVKAKKTERTYLGATPDERRKERRTRLLEAALDVIGTGGLGALTMTQVAGRAGLTERYFYESFSDRDALVREVFSECLADVDRRIIAALVACKPTLEARAGATAEALVAVLTDDPRKARLFVEASGSEVLGPLRRAALVRYSKHLATHIGEGAALTKASRASLAVSTRMIVGGLAEALQGWVDGSLDVSKDALVKENVRLCMSTHAALRGGKR